MIWLTWRQFRVQAAAAAIVLAVLGVLFAVTGAGLSHQYAVSGLPVCHAHGDCGQLANVFVNELRSAGVYKVVFTLGTILMYVVPPIIGVFWGAPLVTRELESGTFRLAWTQSVTPNRWLAVKLGVLGLASAATAGLLSLMVTWWSVPVDKVSQYGAVNGALSRIGPAIYGTRDIVPVGYALFGFALGVAVGTLIRRTLPAMALTLAGTAFAEIAMPLWIRGHLIPPIHSSGPLNVNDTGLMITQAGQLTIIPGAGRPGAWILSERAVTTAGKAFTGQASRACMDAGRQQCNAWLASLHLRQLITFQPASRFWELQIMETGIFVLLALLLAGFCAWRLGRRRFS
ncbi:MAG TPA: ABC transporter permease [Streptosporangiaceae bacterium]|jgi:hypothetical protein